jgi:enediyne biosynthesis protein E4
MRQGSSRLFVIVLVGLLLTGSHAKALHSQEEQTRIRAGLAYLASRKPLDAIREFQRVIELNPSIVEVHFYLSQAYGQTEEWSKALEQIDRAIQLDSTKAQYFNQRGLIFSRQKKFNQALPDVLRAIDLKPVDYIEYYYFNLALVYRDLLRSQDAIEAYQKTLLVAPKFSRAHLGLGEIYLERNLTEKAIEEFSLAVSLDPKLAKAHLQLGLAEARAGKHGQAVEAFQKALELEPTNHRIHYNLSMSLKRLGRDSEAQEHLEIFKKSQGQAEEEEYRELQVEISKRTDLRNAASASVSSSPAPELKPINKSSKLAAPGAIVFTEAASRVGIQFRHINGATPEKYMPETMGSGCLFFDYNDDGWIDIFLVNAGSLVDAKLAAASHNALYRNNGDGTFSDVTEYAGLKNRGYGMGACAADYDNDGRKDLYLTNFGSNVLYHHSGDGTFIDVTEKAGVGFSSWGSSCAFADINNDGYLDLFVVNYVDFGLSNNKFCGSLVEGLRSYCHPNVYRGLPNVLYRNNGNGTFTDITQEAGVFTRIGKGLGVAFGDYDNDGWADAFVANDSVPNFLYRNLGNGSFSELGLSTGVAVDENGLPKAGMGTDWGDFDNDGLLDIYVTNLNSETNTLYRNNGGGLFTDVTWQAGLGGPTLPFVGFGTAFLDYDNDGHLDIVVANGHILDNVSLSRDNLTYAQRKLLFHNEGDGTFREMGLSAGPGMALEKVSRGLAVGDVDNDGDLDLLINNCNQTADLLLNENRTGNHWLVVRLVGTKSNRDGIGTRLKLVVSGLTQVREIKAGSSYQSQNDIRAHFGLGKTANIGQLELRWPSGTLQVLRDLQADQILTIREGVGIVGRGPYSAHIHPSGAAK